MAPPRIARQEVCQTCFICEAHCPEDAMYVAPMRHPAQPGSPHLDEITLLREGYFGSYRARFGMGRREQAAAHRRRADGTVAGRTAAVGFGRSGDRNSNYRGGSA